MEQLLLEFVKNVPFTVAVLVIYFLLTRQQLTNARKDSESKDALFARLLSLMDKLSSAIESSDKTMQGIGSTIHEQADQIETNSQILQELRKDIKELKEYANSKIRVQRTSDPKSGSSESITISQKATTSDSSSA